jgi:hypothetical protein
MGVGVVKIQLHKGHKPVRPLVEEDTELHKALCATDGFTRPHPSPTPAFN